MILRPFYYCPFLFTHCMMPDKNNSSNNNNNTHAHTPTRTHVHTHSDTHVDDPKLRGNQLEGPSHTSGSAIFFPLTPDTSNRFANKKRNHCLLHSRHNVSSFQALKASLAPCSLVARAPANTCRRARCKVTAYVTWSKRPHQQSRLCLDSSQPNLPCCLLPSPRLSKQEEGEPEGTGRKSKNNVCCKTPAIKKGHKKRFILRRVCAAGAGAKGVLTCSLISRLRAFNLRVRPSRRLCWAEQKRFTQTVLGRAERVHSDCLGAEQKMVHSDCSKNK